ncbi:uncharacterized protein LOC128954107 [Oppia nitens]|uniref:uncharacterized protein LOC128954107 n=1 Tax=Oppia nitens TaxID=1686743 RepID=UPI0023DB92BA|nr:uncharacterized protein LOC128954107 [Oppia nitens]
MTKHLNLSQLSEDYIAVQQPFRGRSASQVLQKDTVLNTIVVWTKRQTMRCRLRCCYSCMDLSHGFRQSLVGSGSGNGNKVADSATIDKVGTFASERLRARQNRWQMWRRFFSRPMANKHEDVMTKKESATNAKSAAAVSGVKRRNAGIFMADYDEELTTTAATDDDRDHRTTTTTTATDRTGRRNEGSLELYDLETDGNNGDDVDSGHYDDMNRTMTTTTTTTTTTTNKYDKYMDKP